MAKLWGPSHDADADVDDDDDDDGSLDDLRVSDHIRPIGWAARLAV